MIRRAAGRATCAPGAGVHLAHDRPWHLLQRWISYRLRYARGDLFLGPYRAFDATIHPALSSLIDAGP